MHTVWKGAISFGLVHVPVKMHAATEDNAKDIVKGYEYEKNKFVIINEEDLEAIKPESARTIKILDFVNLSDIDPIHFEKPYYLSPDMSGVDTLLLKAIKQTGKIGIAKISFHSKSNEGTERHRRKMCRKEHSSHLLKLPQTIII